MPGPLPNPNSRRRNAPTIATTTLPAEGRAGRAPAVPKTYKLGDAGRRWWRWAWRLPQATRWDEGSLYFVARRAQLEDDLDAITLAESATDDGLLAELLAGADEDAIERVESVLGMLKRAASGSATVMKEMRELDNRLGLNPKALADLRWTIAEPIDTAAGGDGGEVTQMAAYRDRLG